MSFADDGNQDLYGINREQMSPAKWGDVVCPKQLAICCLIWPDLIAECAHRCLMTCLWGQMVPIA